MSRPYKNWMYIYPPRPEYVISLDTLAKVDNGTEFLAQCKLNGSCAVIWIKPDEIIIKNRHNDDLSNFKLNNSELKNLNKDDEYLVLVGEYMNKSKKNRNNEVWNHKFVIFDILVQNGMYLLDTTYEERIKILDDMFGVVEYDDYLYKVSDNIYRVKTFKTNFVNLWNEIVKIDMLEGLVLKKSNSKLERGTREKNNLSYKCRKETKNYQR
jgi:ATP-dependent DNA ligase